MWGCYLNYVLMVLSQEGLSFAKVGMLLEKFELKSLKETNLGVIEALYDPSKLLL